MENHPPVIPNPPPRSFQEHDAPLGSSSASPAHPYQRSLQPRRRRHDTINQPPTPATISEGEVGSGQNLFDYPTVSQQAALIALQDYDNENIFASLTGLRSFRPGGKNWFQPGCLSAQQLEAISALKDCRNGLISAWLDSFRCGDNLDAFHSQHGNSYFDVQGAAVKSTHNAWQRSSNTSRSSASSFGAPASLYENCTSPSTPRSSWSRGTFLDLSGEPSIDETSATLPVASAHTHWCFVCEIHRVYITCDGWKRHMKEHETSYPCMPHGRAIYTAHGSECVLCGDSNPDEGHYNLHKILPCSNKTLSARSYTRKIHLIKHLKTHGISDGSALAEEWRDTLDKKFYSCGFCIACFHSHTNQLNHIDNFHYKNHQHISDWESNKIILGLLLQPGVQGSWRNILTVHPRYNELGFRWSPAVVKDLQLRLEKSEETADALALAAFNESTYDWTQETQVESMSVAGFSSQDVDSHHNMPMIWSQALPTQMLFGPDQSPIDNGWGMTTPLRAQYPAWRSIAPNHLNPSVPNANPTTYQNNSSRELSTTNRPQNYRAVLLGLPLSSSNGWAPLGSPHHAPLQGSISTPPNAYDGQSPLSSSLAADENWLASSSPKSLAAYSGRRDNSDAGRAHTTATTQPTSLDLKYPTSPLTQASNFSCRNDANSLPVRPTKQPSRTKLKDHYDIDTEADMDIDLDDIQYFMREEGHTRSEGRRR